MCSLIDKPLTLSLNLFIPHPSVENSPSHRRRRTRERVLQSVLLLPLNAPPLNRYRRRNISLRVLWSLPLHSTQSLSIYVLCSREQPIWRVDINPFIPSKTIQPASFTLDVYTLSASLHFFRVKWPPVHINLCIPLASHSPNTNYPHPPYISQQFPRELGVIK